FPKGSSNPTPFRYFRPQFDGKGELAFVPTAETRLLQMRQALTVGLVAEGSTDQGLQGVTRYYGPGRLRPRNEFNAPVTARKSLPWFEVFGTADPVSLMKWDFTSGALVPSNDELAVAAVGKAFMAATSVTGFLWQTIKIGGSWAAVEKVAEKWGPAAGLGAQL